MVWIFLDNVRLSIKKTTKQEGVYKVLRRVLKKKHLDNTAHPSTPLRRHTPSEEGTVVHSHHRAAAEKRYALRLERYDYYLFTQAIVCL